jgi:L-fuconolactonase
MLRTDFKNGIKSLTNYDFTYDILIFADQLKYAKILAATFQNQRFVLDHIAKPDIKSGNMETWKKDIQLLAREENVCCKISGMVTEADWKNWKHEDFTPFLDVVVESFGIDRIMYGSDWPVCLVAASYQQMLDIVQNYFLSYSENEKSKIFGDNASKFYHLN